MQAGKRGTLSALALATLLAFVLMSGIGCTPIDANADDNASTGTGQPSDEQPGSGGFVMEDSVVVEVDIQEDK